MASDRLSVVTPEVGEAGLRREGRLHPLSLARGRRLGRSIRLLVAPHPRMGWSPPYCEAVPSLMELGHLRQAAPGQGLGRPATVVGDPGDGRLGVREDRIVLVCLLSLVKGSDRPEDGEDLGVENLLIVSQQETGRPPHRSLPVPKGVRRSYPPILQPGSIRPDRSLLILPLCGCPQGLLLALNTNLALERPKLLPDLSLHGVSPPQSTPLLDPGREAALSL